MAAPEPKEVRATVQRDVQGLFLSLGALSLLIGAIGIANVTLVSVLERIGEIGLRRSLGATKRHVAGQFLLESTAIGTLGGVLGTSLGVLAIVVVATARGWTPVLTPWLGIVAPLLGSLTGLVAGTYPAWKAAAIEPIEAMRSGS